MNAVAAGLLVATTNRGKVAELRKMLQDLPAVVSDLGAYPSIEPVEETGRTFGANASLKASYYAKAFGVWTLADDSGLAVDALGGAPGVYSARWAAMHDAGEGDQANNLLVLKQLKDVGDEARGARFVCTLALADPAGRIILTATDWVCGRVLREGRGEGGFGYDPLFFVESQGKTTAEMTADEKNAISHRGKAMRRMVGLMGRAGCLKTRF